MSAYSIEHERDGNQGVLGLYEDIIITEYTERYEQNSENRDQTIKEG